MFRYVTEWLIFNYMVAAGNQNYHLLPLINDNTELGLKIINGGWIYNCAISGFH